jgi:hypothetical protein
MSRTPVGSTSPKTSAAQVRTFCGVLHATGCRLSETLVLAVRRVDLPGRMIVFESHEMRCKGVFHAVPVPLNLLNLVHGIHERSGAGTRRHGSGRGAA